MTLASLVRCEADSLQALPVREQAAAPQAAATSAAAALDLDPVSRWYASRAPVVTREPGLIADGDVSSRAGQLSADLEQLTMRLLERLRLAVVYGGDKAADGAVINIAGNPRSWKSYQTVAHDIASAMRRIGCRHVALIPDDMRLGERLKAERTQMVWLNSGGVQGHCSVAHGAAMLEMFGLPYVGHDPLTAALLDNKYFFKRQLTALGIPTAPFLVWHPERCAPDPTNHRQFAQVFGAWEGDFIVKPVSGRASLHVYHVEATRDLQAISRHVFDVTRNSVLLEGYLPGPEYCIAVKGSALARSGRLHNHSGPFAFAGVERVLAPDERVFASLDVKPISAARVRPLDRASDAIVLEALEGLAETLYAEFPLEALVRLDVRADAEGKLFVLEANPKPDLKAPEGKTTSLIAAGIERCGMTYDDLIFSIFADRVAAWLREHDGLADRLLANLEDRARAAGKDVG